MSRRKPTVSDLNIRLEQTKKRFKPSPTSTESNSTFKNLFQQFDDVIQVDFQPKSSQTSSTTARSIMGKKGMKTDNDQLWSTLFQPKRKDQLVIHSKKIKEVQEMLEKTCEFGPQTQVTKKTFSDLFLFRLTGEFLASIETRSHFGSIGFG